MPHQIRNNQKVFLLFLLLFFLNQAFSQDATVGQATFIVKRGERPPIDLSRISSDSYLKGKFKIKLEATAEGILPQELLEADSKGYVTTGVPALDELNRQFQVKSYRPLFGMLYQTGSQCNNWIERHRAWGFHLWFEVEIPERVSVLSAIEQFKQLSFIELAEPEYRKVLISEDGLTAGTGPVVINSDGDEYRWIPNDPEFGNQWHYRNTGQQGGTPGADIRLAQAWDIEKGNQNVIVAVIDGGIDYNHPDLSGNMWSGLGYNFVTGSSVIQPHNHGTHVAGTVAAVTNNSIGVSGIAGGSGFGNGVRLMSCQVFTASSNGGFHLAPVYAADNGAAISQNSWGYTSPGVYDQAVLDAIDYFNINGGGTALQGGVTIFAAGNSNSSANYYPAFYSGTYAVAATNNQDIKAYYSNFGTWINISAPGGETNVVSQRGVLSTLPNNSYGYYQGTSMACPHVSGVAALMVSRGFGLLTATQVRNILTSTADDHYSVNQGYIGLLGAGRLNANAALQAVVALVALENPSNFMATPVSPTEINLSWQKNQYNHDVMLVWSPNGTFGIPINGVSYQVGQTISGGGTIIYRGGNTSFLHSGLQPYTTYYYKAYSFNNQNQYSPGVTTQATTLQAPIIDFTAKPNIQLINAPVTFTDISTGGNFTSWSWNFGVGANPPTATGKGPHNVTYSNQGYKTVSLTVNGIYTTTKTNFVTIVAAMDSAQATYTSGNIPTDRNFTSTTSSSSCPGYLTVTIPPNAKILSVNVEYSMTAQNGGLRSNQRSQLRCVSPGGTSEPTIYAGTVNSPGTQFYRRTGLTIANGVAGGGNIAFELHAGRTWGGTGCNTLYNFVNNNTWKVTVFYIGELEPVANFTASPTTLYAGGTVSFTDLSTNNPTQWQWSFPGGTPSSSTSQHPQVIYNIPGTYNVSLTVTNAFGSNTKTITKYITVLPIPLPVADFTASPTTLYAGGAVSFTDLSTNNPTQWQWSFPGGTPSSSTSQHPQVIYDIPGTYDVTLTVTNAFGSDTKTRTQYITVLPIPLPVADFTASPTTLYAGGTVSFTDLSTNNPTQWQWSFPGGTPSSSTSQNPQVIYNIPGTYDVTLTVTNAFGSDTKTRTQYITVLPIPLPVADFTASPTTLYAGGTVSFTDLSTNNPTQWQWSFPGGTPSSSTSQHPQVIYNIPGTYDVTLTVTNAFGPDTKTRTQYITVLPLPLPVADFTASPTTLYAGGTVSFTDLSTNNPTQWQWSFPGGTPSSSTSQNPQVIYNIPGTYDVTLTVTNVFGSDTKTRTQYITVLPLPLPVADFTATPTSLYAGGTVSFTDLSTNNPTQWQWSFPGGTPSSSTSQNPQVIYNIPGTYDVTLTVTNAFGSDTKTRTGYIQVIGYLLADFTSDKTQIHTGEVVHFYDQSVGNPTFWIWEIEGGTPSVTYQQNPIVQFNTPGQYNVRLTVYRSSYHATILKENYIQVTQSPSVYPPGWEFQQTGIQHIIAVPISSNPRILEIPIQQGDFIGVFYQDNFGQLKCGGATQWDGTQNIAIVANGDNPYTPFKDGFGYNEEFSWKIYSYSHQREFNAVASYDPTQPFRGNFYPLGTSALNDLYAGVLFNANIPAGWSGVSSPVQLYYPAMNQLINPIVGNLVILFNHNGMIWPDQNIFTLTEWSNTGYSIKVNGSSTLVFGGDPYKNAVFTVRSGVNYFPVLSLCQVNTASLFVSQTGRLTMIRNILGTEVFWPELGINTLPFLKPGNAYLTIAKLPFNITFPACQSKSIAIPQDDVPETFGETGWQFAEPCPGLHLVAITGEATGILQEGDIIGFFTNQGIAAGWTKFTGEPPAIPVFGNDPTSTSASGFSEGEPLRIRIYRSAEQQTLMAEAHFDPSQPDQGNFRSGGISVITGLKLTSNISGKYSDGSTVRIYPNPGTGLFSLQGLAPFHTLTISTPEGKNITTLPTGGLDHFTLDLTGYPAGVYLIFLAGTQQNYSGKLFLMNTP